MTARRCAPTVIRDDAQALRIAWRTIVALQRLNTDLRSGRAKTSYTAAEVVRLEVPRLEKYMTEKVDRDTPNTVGLNPNRPKETTP